MIYRGQFFRFLPFHRGICEFCGGFFFALDKVYGLLQMAIVLAIPVIASYNGEWGRRSTLLQYGFYLYYPLHLLLLALLKV